MEVQNIFCKNFKKGNIIDLKAEIPAYLLQCVESIAKKEGFVSQNVKSKKLTSDGGNYLADLYEIDITGQTSKGNKEVYLFIKYIVSAGTVFNGFLSMHKAYMIEGFVYRELSKVFKKLEEAANIPVDERYKMVKGFEETTSEVIIMENLSKKGFKTCDRTEAVPLKFVELSVQQLAKFHGLGFAVKDKMPIFYEKNISSIKLTDIVQYNEEWRKFYCSMAELSLKNLRPDLKKKAEIFLSGATTKFKKYFTDSTSIQILCHGDFRVNNILVKESEGEVVEVVPVDMQIVHHGCPVNDFMYFIYGCTDRQFRDQHMSEMIALYYNTLRNYLKYFDIDVADVYPRNKLDDAIKERADYGLTIALGLYPLFFASENNHPDLSGDNSLGKDIDLAPEIVRRIEEIIEETIDAGVL